MTPNGTIKETTNENEKSTKKPRVVITGESLFSGINEKRLSKNYHVKVKHFPGGTAETILEEVKELLKNKSDTLTVHAGINDLTKGKNVVNYVKKNY